MWPVKSFLWTLLFDHFKEYPITCDSDLLKWLRQVGESTFLGVGGIIINLISSLGEQNGV